MEDWAKMISVYADYICDILKTVCDNRFPKYVWGRIDSEVLKPSLESLEKNARTISSGEGKDRVDLFLEQLPDLGESDVFASELSMDEVMMVVRNVRISNRVKDYYNYVCENVRFCVYPHSEEEEEELFPELFENFERGADDLVDLINAAIESGHYSIASTLKPIAIGLYGRAAVAASAWFSGDFYVCNEIATRCNEKLKNIEALDVSEPEQAAAEDVPQIKFVYDAKEESLDDEEEFVGFDADTEPDELAIKDSRPCMADKVVLEITDDDLS